MTSWADTDRARIAAAAETLGASCTEAQLEGLAAFVELVAVWNARSNLTGAKDPEALVDVLLADAFVLADPQLVPAGSRLVDVGAGAGAPAIPLALLRDDVSVTLVEPRRLRVAFVRTAIGALQLADRVHVEERKLGGAPLAGVPFDVAMSRATFGPAVWLERGRPLAQRVLVLTGADALPEAQALTARRDYDLPFAGKPRRIGAYDGA